MKKKVPSKNTQKWVNIILLIIYCLGFTYGQKWLRKDQHEIYHIRKLYRERHT